MKKHIAMLLVVALSLSLAACGGSKVDPRYNDLIEALDNHEYDAAYYELVQLREQAIADGHIDEPPTPQDEDWKVINAYVDCARNLKNYVENGSVSFWDSDTETNYEGSAALGQIYKELQGLEAVDKWLAEERVNFGFDGMVRDRQKLLDGFTKLEDQYLKVAYKSVDNMGNENSGTYRRFYYDANGVLIRSYLSNNYPDPVTYNANGYFHYTYDASGKLTQFKIGDENAERTEAVIAVEYDANGFKVKETVTNNEGDRTYTYTNDAQGRPVKVEWSYNNNLYEAEYTYTADGAADQIVKRQGNTQSDGSIRWYYEYIYDYAFEGSKPTGMTYTYNYYSHKYDSATKTYNPEVYYSKVDNYVYTCDDQNRIITEQITYGNTQYAEGKTEKPDLASRTVTHTYGDYYFYAPVA